MSTITEARERVSTRSIRWVLAHDPISTFEEAAKYFADFVRQETAGKLEIQILTRTDGDGDGRTTPEMALARLMAGEIEMCQTYTSVFGRLHPELWVVELPGLFRDHEHALKVLDGPLGQRMKQGLLKHNLRALEFTYSGGYRLITAPERRVLEVDDLHGARIRILDNPVAHSVFESFGAEPVAAPSHQIAALTREGRIDCAETTYPRFWADRLYETHRTVNETGHSLLTTVVAFNESIFSAMPERFQRVIVEGAREMARRERVRSLEEGERARALSKEKGLAVMEPSPEQKERFLARARSVYERWIPLFGKGLVENISSAR